MPPGMAALISTRYGSCSNNSAQTRALEDDVLRIAGCGTCIISERGIKES